MFSKLSLSLAGLLTLAAAQTAIPSTLIIYVIDTATGSSLGTLNGYGNFSSPGPSYPFRSAATTGIDSTLDGYSTCTITNGVLNCYLGTGPIGSFYVSVSCFAFISGVEYDANLDDEIGGGNRSHTRWFKWVVGECYD